MQTKLSLFCDRLIEAGWLAAAAVIPAFFNVYSSRVFEPDKLTLLRVIAVIMLTAFVVKTVESDPRNLSLSGWLRSFATATPLAIPVLIFLAVYIITTFTSVVPTVSFWGSYQRLQGTLVNLSYLTVFFLTAHHLRTRAQLNRLIWVIILDSFIISFYGIIQHFRLDPLPWGGDVTMRVTSTMGNAIFLAAYLIMAVPIALSVLVSKLSLLMSQTKSAANSTDNSSPLFSAPVFYPVLAVIAGTGSFGFLSKAVQYIASGRGLTEFAFADTLVLLVGGLLVSGGVALIILKPAALPTIRQLPLQFFLASALTTILELQLATILYAKSRGPWIGIALGLAVFTFLFLLRNRQYIATAIAAGLITPIIVFVVLLNINNSPVAYLKTQSPYLERLGSISDMDSGTSKVRLLIWFGDGVGKGATGLITSNPIRTIIGYGPESMYVAYNPFYPPELANLEARNASPDRSHNDFLDFLVTMGVVGLVSYLAIIVSFFYFTARLLWRSDDKYTQIVIIGLMAAIAAHLAETFFGIAIAATRTHFWLYLASAGALYLMARPTKVPVREVSPGTVNPIEARIRGASPDLPTSSARRQRARNRRAATSSVPTMSDVRRGTTSWVNLVPLLIYLGFTGIGVPTLLLSNIVQSVDEPKWVVIFGFLWLLLGIVLTAAWVRREERPSVVLRSSRLWLYVPLLGVVAYIIVFSLLGSVIADVHFKKAQAYDNVRRFDISTHEYLQALSWAPSQDFYYLFLGRAYLETAKNARDQQSTMTIGSVNDLFALDKRRGVALSRDDLFNASLVSLRMAKDLNPLNTDNSANLGRLHRFWGEVTTDPAGRSEKLEIASQYYADALALSPNAAHLYDEWGLVYYVQGQPEKAIAKYEQALALDKKYVATYVYLGEIYLAQNQLDKAEEMLKQATKIDNSLVNAHSSLGYIYHQQGKIQEALEENLKAAAVAPNDFSTRRNLAVIYQELGTYDKAIAEAQVALSLAPQDQKAPVQNFIVELQRRRSGG